MVSGKAQAKDPVVDRRNKKRKIPDPIHHNSSLSYGRCSESLGGIRHLVLRLMKDNWDGKKKKEKRKKKKMKGRNILFCLVKAKASHPTQASPPNAANLGISSRWQIEPGNAAGEWWSGGWMKLPVLCSHDWGKGLKGCSSYLSFPFHTFPGDFPLFFSLSLQIFFLFIQFSFPNFFNRSSSVSHFAEGFSRSSSRGSVSTLQQARCFSS